MNKHTELPWKITDEHPNGEIYIGTEQDIHLIIVTPFPGRDVLAIAELIVLACNSRKDLLAACKNAVKQMQDEPVQGQGEWDRGLFCGLEDRDITDRYDACRHGYDKALDKVQEWIIDEIEAAIEKARPSRAVS